MYNIAGLKAQHQTQTVGLVRWKPDVIEDPLASFVDVTGVGETRTASKLIFAKDAAGLSSQNETSLANMSTQKL